ncbi:unnamed protein product [Protopolystoma xenopodis]|uniref:Uncharacterized protein n=1 Tax=Protopolystoma xenopodis TaxID=117903 RepID=A0A448WN03_9PLAT|nr:unnamed protein product [Protopolystoma xenopodis]
MSSPPLPPAPNVQVGNNPVVDGNIATTSSEMAELTYRVSGLVELLQKMTMRVASLERQLIAAQASPEHTLLATPADTGSESCLSLDRLHARELDVGSQLHSTQLSTCRRMPPTAQPPTLCVTTAIEADAALPGLLRAPWPVVKAPELEASLTLPPALGYTRARTGANAIAIANADVNDHNSQIQQTLFSLLGPMARRLGSSELHLLAGLRRPQSPAPAPDAPLPHPRTPQSTSMNVAASNSASGRGRGPSQFADPPPLGHARPARPHSCKFSKRQASSRPRRQPTATATAAMESTTTATRSTPHGGVGSTSFNSVSSCSSSSSSSSSSSCSSSARPSCPSSRPVTYTTSLRPKLQPPALHDETGMRRSRLDIGPGHLHHRDSTAPPQTDVQDPSPAASQPPQPTGRQVCEDSIPRTPVDGRVVDSRSLLHRLNWRIPRGLEVVTGLGPTIDDAGWRCRQANSVWPPHDARFGRGNDPVLPRLTSLAPSASADAELGAKTTAAVRGGPMERERGSDIDWQDWASASRSSGPNPLATRH